MTSISAGHIILTPTQPVGSWRPQRGSNPGPPDQESRALPTELPRPPPPPPPNDKETDVIAAEVAMVDLVVELNLPLSTLDRINTVVKKVFKDSDIAKIFHCARSKGTAIVKEIGAKSTFSLGERISRQPFTVSTDGSNDVGCHKLYPLVIRSVHPDSLEVSTEILTIPICEGSSTGENIFNLIDAEFKAHKIPWENCLALGADNAPVMVGKDKGVYGHMCRKNPSIFMAGCVCHLIHICRRKRSCMSAI